MAQCRKLRCRWSARADDQPSHTDRIPRGPRLATEGVQHGTFFSSGGPPQLLQICLGPDEHLVLVLSPRGIDIFPLDQEMPQGTDLTHAATYTATHRDSGAVALESMRLVWALLAKQWPTALHLQKRQCARGSRWIPAVAILLVLWTDCSLAMRFVAGFSNC